MHHQRKGRPNCFEQGSYHFSDKKRRAEEAKPKGAAVSHQCNQDLTVRNKHMYFSVAFLNSLSKIRRPEFLWTRVLQFVPQEKVGRRIKAWGCCCFFFKGSTIYLSCWHEWASLLYLWPQYILFRLMVHFNIFNLNVCDGHTTTRSLPQNWRIYWLRLFFEKI